MKSLNVVAGIMVAPGSGGVLGQHPSPPAPTQPNTVANCLTWHVVSAGDTCLTIETAFGITHTDFLAWNPNVNSECTVNFWGAYAYCVGAPPAPIHPGTATNCNAWHVVAAGETCASVETTAAITARPVYGLEPCRQRGVHHQLLGHLRLLCRRAGDTAVHCFDRLHHIVDVEHDDEHFGDFPAGPDLYRDALQL